jgi:hypothetical protein
MGLGKLTVLNPSLIITYPSVWLERPRSRKSSHVGISQGTGLHNVEVFSVCGMCSSRKSNYWICTGSAMLSASAVWPFVCTFGRQYPFPNVFQVPWSLWHCVLPGLKSQCLYRWKTVSLKDPGIVVTISIYCFPDLYMYPYQEIWAQT